MGHTPKPLKIITIGDLKDWPEIAALDAQGHEIIAHALTHADLILGPTCWLMDEQHRKYLDLAIAEARRRRYPPTKKASA